MKISAFIHNTNIRDFIHLNITVTLNLYKNYRTTCIVLCIKSVYSNSMR